MSRKASILFKAYMSRALLDKVKTQTRRLDQGFDVYEVGDICAVRENFCAEEVFDKLKPSEIMKVADHARFTFWYHAGGSMTVDADGARTIFEDDNRPARRGKLRPSIFIPDVATRQTVIMESVRKERLLDISDEDAIAEGIRAFDHPRDLGDGTHAKYYAVAGLEEQTKSITPTGAYFRLWDLINGEGSHQKNPAVNVWGFSHWPVNFEDVR